VGMVAAVRLLDRGSAGWWMATISVVLVAGLAVLAGPHLLVPVALAAMAILVTLVRRIINSRGRRDADRLHRLG
ncbi:MAG: amino acid permease-associated protein, partial [Rhodoglobus sp.]